MPSTGPFRITVKELDALGLCQEYHGTFRPSLVELCGEEPGRQLSLAEITSVMPRSLAPGEALVVVARLAQLDEHFRLRLAGFINDAISWSLPVIEARWPGDPFPRAGIIATSEYRQGLIPFEDWQDATDRAIESWAALLAPTALVAHAEWLAVRANDELVCHNFHGWDSRIPIENGWASFARWAGLSLAIAGLVERQRGEPDCAGQEFQDACLERLSYWLDDESPEPVQLPRRSQAPGARSGLANAATIGKIEMEWPSLAGFPRGLVQVEAILLERNAVLTVPGGVERIGAIEMRDHPVLTLPTSLVTIGEVKLSYESELELPAGIEELGRVELFLGSVLTLPSSTRRIGEYVPDIEPDDFEHYASEEEFWAAVDRAEAGEQLGENDWLPSSHVLYEGRQLRRPRTDFVFR